MWKNNTEKISTYVQLNSTSTSGFQLSSIDIIGLSILNGISSFIGVAGNFMALVALVNNKDFQTKTDNFIASLVCADLIVTLICQPMTIYEVNYSKQLSGGNNTDSIFFEVKKAFGYFAMLASVSSIWAVSVDRFISIRFPLRYHFIFTKKRVLGTISVIWLLSLAMSAGYCLYAVQVGGEGYILCIYCTLVLVTTLVINAYILVVAWKRRKSIFTLGMITTGFIAEMTNKVNEPRRKRSSRLRGLQPMIDNKATKTVGMIAGVLLVCWFPLLVFNFFEGLRKSSTWQIRQFKWLWTISMCNSCCNPYIYCFRNQKYRSMFARNLKCCFPASTNDIELQSRRRTFSMRKQSDNYLVKTAIRLDY